MIKSMTGYGISQSSDEMGSISVEIKSVNHRYLELSTKLPKGYAFLEEHIKGLVKEKLHRGKVEVFLSIERFNHFDNIKIDYQLANAYVDALVCLKNKYNLIDDISVSLISKYPDVLMIEKNKLDENYITQAVLNNLNLAVNELNNMREREGENLKLDINFRLNLICSIVNDIERKAPEILKTYKEKLEQNIRNFINEEKIIIDEYRILTEVAVFADKIAVDEETVRIKSHIDQLKTLLESDTEVGRKMDFLVQELNREINTIGSKIQNVDISMMVVNIKAQLEKIREQIQNIE